MTPQEMLMQIENPPDAVYINARNLQLLRAKLTADYRKCFGADSKSLKFEETAMRRLNQSLEDFTDMTGCDFSNTPLCDGKESQDHFVKDMNEILTWAGIPQKAHAESMAEHDHGVCCS
jgi:hypothetical protein